MESFHIDSELVEDSKRPKNIYGNMKVFNNGKTVFNRKAKGIFITLTMTILSAVILGLLMYI